MRAKRTLSPKFLKIKRKKVALFIVGKASGKTSDGLDITFVTTFGVADGVNKDVVDSEVVAEDLFN